jgi:ribosome modulation factor
MLLDLRPTAYDAGHRDGFLGRHVCYEAFTTGTEYLDWYRGWRDGRAARESEIVERIGVAREFAREFYLRGRTA